MSRAAYDGEDYIGQAESWEEVEALLRARGRSGRAAEVVVMTRGVDTGRAFHIVDAGSLDRILADVRRLLEERRRWKEEQAA